MSPSPVLAAVLSGLLSTILRQYCLRCFPSTMQEEFSTGWLTWVLLYASCRYFSTSREPAARLSNVRPRPDGRPWSARLTVPGLSAAVVAVHLTRNGAIFRPAIPFVTLASLLVGVAGPTLEDARLPLKALEGLSDGETHECGLLDRSISSQRVAPRAFVNLLLVLLLYGSVSYSDRPIPVTAATSFVFVVAQTVILGLISRSSSKAEALLPTVLDWALLERLSISLIACFTCLLVSSIPTWSLPNLLVFPRAVIEAASWTSLFILCGEKRSITATTFDTVATSFDAVAGPDGGLKVLTSSISCIMSLWQSVTDVPPSQKGRNWLYLLLLVPLLSLSQNKLNFPVGSELKRVMARMHPIERIVQNARGEYSDLLRAQSRTVDEARGEYIRRYGRIPPPNFNAWFDLAMEHEFSLVDEFDSMMRTFEPFWGVAPSMLQRLVTDVHEQFSTVLVRYEVLDGRIEVTGGPQNSWFPDAMQNMLPAEWAALLPNMTLAVNTFDEPAVSIPRDTLDAALKRTLSKDLGVSGASDIFESTSHHGPRFLNIDKQDAWEAITLSCPVDSPARNPNCQPLASGTFPGFIGNVSKSRDVCEHCELQDLEGIFMAPETLRLTHSLVPIWSQATPSSFNDIVFPSPYYLAIDIGYDEAEDREWSDKANRLYWVGSATGGHSTEFNWDQMQRQRMALMTQLASVAPIQLLNETSPGVWTPYSASMSDVSSLFSTRVMRVTGQCEHAACKVEKQAFEIGDQEVADPASAPYSYRFLLDLDGNSFSGRFYRLLRSKSMVIKQTVFEEWHDDRLIPWIHYVPVSTGFQELPELLRFLATTARGEEIASQIASESQQWADKALRPVDMQLVWLRMLLEYGRILDPNREG